MHISEIRRLKIQLAEAVDDLEKLASIKTRFKEEHCMPLDPTIVAVIKAIDDASNAIAARIQKLIDQAASAGSVTAQEVTDALAPEVAKLQALGADPNNPVG